jgi:uncharacterized protein with GYD domain
MLHDNNYGSVFAIIMAIAIEHATETHKSNILYFYWNMTQRYVILMRWTEQGIRNFEDTIKRAEATRSEAEKTGGKFTLYLPNVQYDGIGILEAPNDEAAMQFGLKVGSLGKFRTTTLRAFTQEEIESVIDNLG